MKLRVELSMAIEDIIEAKGWSQWEAAEHVGTSPQRLNDVLRGRVHRVTIDRLVNRIAAAGQHVCIEVGKAAGGGGGVIALLGKVIML